MKHEPNPKKLMGDKKPPLHLLPLAGKIHQSLAHMDGDLKYGFENWNETPVEKLTYIGAIERHTGLYKYGENYARDTNVHNLGAVMACCAILLDAELNGNLIDNTRHSKATCDLLHNAESVVEALKEMQREREAAKQTKIDKEWAEAEAQRPLTATEVVAEGNAIITALTDLEKKLYGETPLERCTPCTNAYGCFRSGACLHPPKFTTCGKCKNLIECARAGKCLGL